MSDTNKLNELATRLFEALPEGVKSVHSDVKATLQQTLKSGLQKMNLVSREEFDVQEKILARTRKKLSELEKHVAALEKKEND